MPLELGRDHWVSAKPQNNDMSGDEVARVSGRRAGKLPMVERCTGSRDSP